MSTNTSETQPISIQETFAALQKRNSEQTTIKKFLLDNTNITKTQRRAVVSLIAYFKEVNHNGLATQSTQQTEQQAQTTHHAVELRTPDATELTNTHGKCEIVTKNPKRTRNRRKNDKPRIRKLTPATTPEVVTPKKLVTEFIPKESKDSTSQTLETEVNLNKHVDAVIKCNSNSIKFQHQAIDDLTTDVRKLQTIDPNSVNTHRILTTKICKLESIVNQLPDDINYLNRRNIARHSIRAVRIQVFTSLKTKHQKDKSLFTNESKLEAFEKILSQLKTPEIEAMIITKAQLSMTIHLGGEDWETNGYQPVSDSFILHSLIKKNLNNDLQIFTINNFN